MKNKLSFIKMDDLRGSWFVENEECSWIGTVERGTDFPKRFVLKEIEYHAEYTSENLRQIADFIDSVEKKEKLKKETKITAGEHSYSASIKKKENIYSQIQENSEPELPVPVVKPES
jgi:hypothetical protein